MNLTPIADGLRKYLRTGLGMVGEIQTQGAGGSGGGSGITIGTTTITGGTDTRVLFDDGGKVGESAGLTYVKGTGTLTATAMSTGNLVATGTLSAGATGGTLQFSNTAGAGPTIAAATAITDVNALSITQTWNNAAVTTGVNIQITNTAAAASANYLRIRGGVAGTTDYLSVGKGGHIWSAGAMLLGGQTSITAAVNLSSGSVLFYDSGFTGVSASIISPALGGTLYKGGTNSVYGFTGSTDGSAALTSGLSQTAAGEISFGTGAAGSVAGVCRAASYKAGAVAGVTAGPFTAITSIQVIGGIVTTLTGT